MCVEFVAEKEIRANIGNREVVRRREPRLVHQQRPRTVSNRLTIENNAHTLAARFDDNAITIMRDRFGKCRIYGRNHRISHINI